MDNTSNIICIIITGGTVLETASSHVLGVKSRKDIAAWARAMPELSLTKTHLEIQIFHEGSDADLPASVWLKTARFIDEHRALYAGFVILAGVDAIPYYSQALTLMLETPTHPIILTGSQLPDYLLQDSAGVKDISSVSQDAGIRANLINALHVAEKRINGVYVIFGDKLIFPGKLQFKYPLAAIPFSYDTGSVVGKVEFSIKIAEEYEKKFQENRGKEMRLHPFLEPNVRYFEYSPLVRDRNFLEELSQARGAIFHLPNTVSLPDRLLLALDSLPQRIPIVCFGESLILPRKENLKKLKERFAKQGIIIVRDSAKEWIVASFMWLLGQSDDAAFIAKYYSKGL